MRRRFVRDNGTNQTKEWTRGRKLAATKLLVRQHVHLCDATQIHSRVQIGWQKILRLFLKTFNLVPGEPGFSWDLS